MGKRLRKRKQKLFEENPYCYYCGTKLILVKLKRGETTPDNLATIEHLRSRLDENRQEINDGITERTVLSCYRCNLTKGREKELELPIEELHKRSHKDT